MKAFKVLTLVGVFSLQGIGVAMAAEIKGEQNIKATANGQVQTNASNSQQKMKIGSVEGKGTISGKQKINSTANAQVQTNTSNSKQEMEIGTVR
jgi:hypothetical protein